MNEIRCANCDEPADALDLAVSEATCEHCNGPLFAVWNRCDRCGEQYHYLNGHLVPASNISRCEYCVEAS